MTEINLNPDNNISQARNSVFNGNKGLMIAIVLGIVAVIIGVSTLIGFKSSNQYEGMIKKVQTQTEQFKSGK